MPTDAWEARMQALWDSFDDADEGFVARVHELTAELPDGDPVAAFERAGAFDSTGREAEAVALYREALAAGLDGPRRRRAVIQLASSLRNVGELTEAVSLLRAERDRGSDELDDAVDAFLALALVDSGGEREAVSLALGALAKHLPRYTRSVTNYAAEL